MINFKLAQKYLIINQKGLNIATGSKYADQMVVFESVGKEIIDNAFLGYHCCLFAYG